ncbi:EamA family transporter [uncultured Eudoraea sp.]|uniref:EamA family transporter n=1 Tax=uncultured Eudoraea sp. TaxID=1035614 RepID=UPI0034585B2F
MNSPVYIVVLYVLGTSIAKVLFNELIHISSPVFWVLANYLLPVTGVFRGRLYGKNFVLQQFLAACILIFGVYLVNRKKNKIKSIFV